MQAPPVPPHRADPPTVVIHDATHARLAITIAGKARLRRLRLLSAPDAACFMGPAWWRSLVGLAAVPAAKAGLELVDVLDCGDAAGRAVEALRLGQRVLVLDRTTQWDAVRARANALGAVLLSARPPALDLARPGAERLLPAWLAGNAADDRTGPPS